MQKRRRRLWNHLLAKMINDSVSVIWQIDIYFDNGYYSRDLLTLLAIGQFADRLEDADTTLHIAKEVPAGIHLYDNLTGWLLLMLPLSIFFHYSVKLFFPFISFPFLARHVSYLVLYKYILYKSNSMLHKYILYNSYCIHFVVISCIFLQFLVFLWNLLQFFLAISLVRYTVRKRAVQIYTVQKHKQEWQ